jgi:hypothetical protein
MYQKHEFIICGDININYLDSQSRREQLDTLLAMYNLKHTVSFPTGVFNGSSTAIDNIFIDLSGNFIINSPINGLSDHTAQLLKLKNAPIQEFTSCYVRIINSFTTDEFQSKLSTKIWEDIFEGSDTNGILTTF